VGILELLNDGKWHSLDEVRRKTELKENEVQQIVEFLKEYSFIILKGTKEAVRIEKAARRL
jgi:DNA-binding IclR family transcriptional regulator